jgi:hypothetical protein
MCLPPPQQARTLAHVLVEIEHVLPSGEASLTITRQVFAHVHVTGGADPATVPRKIQIRAASNIDIRLAAVLKL